MRETTKKRTKVKTNEAPSEISLDIAPIKSTEKMTASSPAPAIAEERIPEETSVHDQQSPRASVPPQDKNKKANGFKIVGFRDKSSRRSAKAFNRKPPEARKSRRRSQSRTESSKPQETTVNAASEQVWFKESEEKLEIPPVEVENLLDQPLEVQWDKTVVDPAGEKEKIVVGGGKQERDLAVTDDDKVDVGGDKQDKAKALSLNGSEVNTSFWERLSEFPEVLTEFPKQFMKRDKEETSFPKFVGHCVVDDIGDAFLCVAGHVSAGDVSADNDSVTNTNEEIDKINDIPKETKTKELAREGTKIDESEANHEADKVSVETKTSKVSLQNKTTERRLHSLEPGRPSLSMFANYFENFGQEKVVPDEPTGDYAEAKQEKASFSGMPSLSGFTIYSKNDEQKKVVPDDSMGDEGSLLPSAEQQTHASNDARLSSGLFANYFHNFGVEKVVADKLSNQEAKTDEDESEQEKALFPGMPSLSGLTNYFQNHGQEKVVPDKPTGEGEGSQLPSTNQQTQASNESDPKVPEQIDFEESIEIQLQASNDSCLAF